MSIITLVFSFTGGLQEAINFGGQKGLISGGTVGLDPGPTFARLFVNLGTILVGFNAAAAGVAIMIGGIMYIASVGNESGAARAKKVILYAIIGLIISAFGAAGVVFVCDVTGIADTAAPACGTARTAIGGVTFASFLANILTRTQNYILGFIAALAGVAIIWGAVLYITSGGDESRASRGKQTILYAIIGLIIAGSLEFARTLVCFVIPPAAGSIFCRGSYTIADYVRVVLEIGGVLAAFVSALAAIAIIYGGFLYVTSRGDESRASQGKQVIFYAVIGLIIAGLAGTIVNIFIL